MAPGEKAEVVRNALAAFERPEGRDVEALVAWCTADIELRSAIIGGAEGNVYRGHDGVRAWLRESEESFDELHIVADDIREVGEVAVALGHLHARGGASGLTLDSPTGWVVWVRDGRMAAMHGYLDHDEALNAARAAAK